MKFTTTYFDYDWMVGIFGKLLRRGNAVRWVLSSRQRKAHRPTPKRIVKAKLRLKASFPWKRKLKTRRRFNVK